MSRFRTIANGNNILIDHSELSQLFFQRNWFWEDGDGPPATYWRPHRDKPMETQLFGTLQWGVTPSAFTAGNTYMEIAFESFYTKGQALPGMIQASG